MGIIVHCDDFLITAFSISVWTSQGRALVPNSDQFFSCSILPINFVLRLSLLCLARLFFQPDFFRLAGTSHSLPSTLAIYGENAKSFCTSVVLDIRNYEADSHIRAPTFAQLFLRALFLTKRRSDT